MSNFFRKKFLLLGLFILFAIICEVMVFAISGLGVFPRFGLVNIAFIFLFAGLLFLIPSNIAQVVCTCILFLVFCFYGGMNVTILGFHGDIVTTDMLDMATEATNQVEGGGVLDIGVVLGFATLGVVFIISQILVLIYYKRRQPQKFEFKRRNCFFLASLFLAIITLSWIPAGITVLALPNNPERSALGITTRDNFDNFYFKRAFFTDFGSFSLIFRNFLMNQPHGGFVPVQTREDANVYFDKPYDFYGGPFHDIDNGNNVIVILMESMDTIFVHETYTPTLYRLMGEGINFTNYHAFTRTDISETAMILGKYPTDDNLRSGWRGERGAGTHRRFTTDFPTSLPNLLKADTAPANFVARYFHNYYSYMYGRTFTHYHFGFNETFFSDDYPDATEDFSDEAVWFYHNIDRILPDCGIRFMSFISTWNIHLPYRFEPRLAGLLDDIDREHFPHISSDRVWRPFRYALAQARVFDAGLEFLMYELEDRNLDKTTTIMLASDHNAYGEGLSYAVKGTNKTTPESFRVPAVIWSYNIANEAINEIDKFVTTFDLTVTLMSILGLDFNPRHYQGINAFADRESVVMSRFGVFFNDYFLTDGVRMLYISDNANTQDKRAFQQRFWAQVDRASFTNTLFFR